MKANHSIAASTTPSTTYGSETFFDVVLNTNTATPANAYLPDLGISATVGTAIVCRSATTTDPAMSC